LASPASDAPPVAPRVQVRRVARSFGFAVEGVLTIVRTQPNFWVHLFAGCLAAALGIVLRLSPAELALIVLTIALVLVAESINTVVETICDLVSPGYHPLVKRAKDVSAGAVLIAAVAALGVAVLLFGPRLASLAGLR
jgi:diacylglycerol kinase (ATP)